MKKSNIILTFREVGGKWLAVDSAQPNPPTLAECLSLKQIIIDDNTQFCRIIRHYETFYEIIEYRAYNGAKITLTINIKSYE